MLAEPGSSLRFVIDWLSEDDDLARTKLHCGLSFDVVFKISFVTEGAMQGRSKPLWRTSAMDCVSSQHPNSTGTCRRRLFDAPPRNRAIFVVTRFVDRIIS
jgi:hypothetical protein